MKLEFVNRKYKISTMNITCTNLCLKPFISHTPGGIHCLKSQMEKKKKVTPLNSFSSHTYSLNR